MIILEEHFKRLLHLNSSHELKNHPIYYLKHDFGLLVHDATMHVAAINQIEQKQKNIHPCNQGSSIPVALHRSSSLK